MRRFLLLDGRCRSAIGLATGIDIRTNVDWVPQKKSWLSSGEFKGSAVARDKEGMVTVHIDESK